MKNILLAVTAMIFSLNALAIPPKPEKLTINLRLDLGEIVPQDIPSTSACPPQSDPRSSIALLSAGVGIGSVPVEGLPLSVSIPGFVSTLENYRQCAYGFTASNFVTIALPLGIQAGDEFTINLRGLLRTPLSPRGRKVQILLTFLLTDQLGWWVAHVRENQILIDYEEVGSSDEEGDYSMDITNANDNGEISLIIGTDGTVLLMPLELEIIENNVSGSGKSPK